MTGLPPLGSDYSKLYGPGSEAAQKDWDLFQQQKQQRLQELANWLGIGSLSSQSADAINPILPASNQGLDLSNTPFAGRTSSAFDDPSHVAGGGSTWGDASTGGQPENWHDRIINTLEHPLAHDLNQERINRLAEAKFWGINGAEYMPDSVLQQVIQQKRDNATRPDELTAWGRLGMASEELGLGFAKAFTGSLQNIPFIGQDIAKLVEADKADAWVHSMEEGIRARLPEQYLEDAKILSGIGEGVGFTFPATAAWKSAEALTAIGPMGSIVTRMSPIARAGVNGALSTWMLRGGANESTSRKVGEIATGAGFAAGLQALTPMLGQLYNRIETAFSNRFTRGLTVDPIELSQLHPEEDVSIPSTSIVPFGGDNLPTAFHGPIPAGPVSEAPQIGSPVRGLLNPGDPLLNPGMYEAGPAPSAPLGLPSVTVGGLESVMPPSRLLGPGTAIEPTQTEALFFARKNIQPGRPVQLPLILSGSRVANFDGTPKLVYHGTDAEFSAFDPSTASVKALYGPGFYHTEDPDVASQYTADALIPLMEAQSNLESATILQQRLSGNDMGMIPLSEPGMQEYLTQIANDMIGVLPVGRIDASKPLPEQLGNVIKYWQERLSILSRKRPNVRPAYLDIKNPFDIDKMYAPQELEPLIQQLDPQQQKVMMARIAAGGRANSTVNGGQAYSLLAALKGDKQQANQALEAAGYDGITHIGGRIMGDREHRVWIAFHPDQIHSPWAVQSIGRGDAAAEAANLTKQATLMESPILDQLAAKADFTNSDVIRSEYAQNPAGVSVVKDIGDLAETVRDLAIGSQGKPLNYRFVNRDGRTDIVIGDHPGLYDLAGEYEKYGNFTGQLVTTKNGKQLVVTKPGSEVVELQNPYHPNLKIRAKAENLFPSRYSHPSSVDYTNPVHNAPAMYDSFREGVMRYMADEAAKADIAVPSEWLDQATAAVLPERMQAFFKEREIESEAQRAVLESYFNVRRVQDIQALAPKEYAHAVEAAQRAAEVEHMEELAGNEPGLDQAAEAKGFRLIIEPGKAIVHLQDMNSGLKMDFEDRLAAEDFLKNFDRELPDMTAGGDLPFETAPPFAPMSDLPSEDQRVETALDNAGTKFDNGKNGDAFSDHIPAGHEVSESLGLFQDVYGDMPPIMPPPPPPAGGNGAADFPPYEPPGELGGTGPDYREAFRRTNAQKLSDLFDKFDGFIKRHTATMRTYFQDLETELNKLGIDFHPFDLFDEVMAGFNRRDAGMRPWIQRDMKILSKVRGKYLRNGIFDYVYRIEDPVEANRVARMYGFTKGEMEALHERAALFREFDDYALKHGILGSHRDFERYVSDVQLRTGQPGIVDPYADTNGRLSPDSKFFADQMNKDGVTVRQVDYRWLDTYYFRSAFYHKEVQPAMAEFLRQAEAPGVPEFLKDVMTQWAQVARLGYDPKPDMAVNGLYSVLKHFGLTKSETRAIMFKGLTWMHWRYMGFRPSVWFRDSIQPILAGARGDIGVLAGVYRDFMRNPAIRKAMIDRAVAGGYYSPEMTGMEMPGIAESEIRNTLGEPALDGYRKKMRGLLQQIGDMWRETVPRPFKGGVRGTIYDPTYAYGKLQGFNRIVAGEMARRMAEGASAKLLAANRIIAGLADESDAALFGLSRRDVDAIAASARDGTRINLYDREQAIKDAGLDSFSPSVKDKYWHMMESGRFGEAEAFAGRQMADETQNVYGIRNAPKGNRSLGSRFAWMFGSFPSQFWGTFVKNSLRYGALSSRAKTLLTLSTVMFGLKELEAKTHWNFGSWIWARTFGWAGGPAFTELTDLALGAEAKLSRATGGYVSDTQAAGEKEFDKVFGTSLNPLSIAGHVASGLAGGMNPVHGLFQTTGDLLNDVRNAPDRLEAVGRTLLTGQAGSGVDYQQMFDVQGRDMLDQYIQQRNVPNPAMRHLLAPSHPGNAAR